MRIDRRVFLAGGGYLLAGAAGLGQLAHAQTRGLRVTHYGGPFQILETVVGKPFSEQNNVSVVYEVEFSSSAFAKIQAQRERPPFDIVLVSRAFGLRALHSDLLTKVSAADFPEAANVSPGIIPQAGWGAAAMLDTVDIMVDTKQIPTPVTSWLDLWRDDMKGKIILPSAVNGATCFGFLACLVKAVGGNMNSDAAVNEVFARLKKLKPAVRSFYTDGSQPNLLIERGDIGVAPQFGIRIANTSRQSPHIVKVTPKEGVLAAPYDLCITKNSANVDLAKKYINFVLTKKIQEAQTTNLLATPVRKDVTIPPNLASYINTKQDAIWFQDEELAASKQRAWLDRFTREVQA